MILGMSTFDFCPGSVGVRPFPAGYDVIMTHASKATSESKNLSRMDKGSLFLKVKRFFCAKTLTILEE